MNKLLSELQNQVSPDRQISISAVEEINRLHKEIIAAAVSSLIKAIRIGEILSLVKEVVGHGNFMDWLSENAVFSDRSARDYLRCFDHRDQLAPKMAESANLSVAQALAYLAFLENSNNGSKEPPRLHEPNFHSQAVRLRQNLVALFNHHLQRRPLKVWHTEEIYDLFCSLKPMTEICSQLESELNTRDDVPSAYRQATAS